MKGLLSIPITLPRTSRVYVVAATVVDDVVGSIGVTASLPFAEEAVLMLAVDMVDVVVFVLSSVLASSMLACN